MTCVFPLCRVVQCYLPLTGQSRVRLEPGRTLTRPPTVALRLWPNTTLWSETFLHDTAMAGGSEGSYNNAQWTLQTYSNCYMLHSVCWFGCKYWGSTWFIALSALTTLAPHPHPHPLWGFIKFYTVCILALSLWRLSSCKRWIYRFSVCTSSQKRPRSMYFIFHFFKMHEIVTEDVRK